MAGHGFLEDEHGDKSSLRLISVCITAFICLWGSLIVICNMIIPSINLQYALDTLKATLEALCVLLGFKGVQAILSSKAGDILTNVIKNKEVNNEQVIK
jgi:hypothetical protein